MKSAVQPEAIERTTLMREHLEFCENKIVVFLSFEVQSKTSIYLIGSLFSYLAYLSS